MKGNTKKGLGENKQYARKRQHCKLHILWEVKKDSVSMKQELDTMKKRKLKGVGTHLIRKAR